MALPTISVINFTTDVSDRDAQRAIRAVNRQIREDFASIWGAIWELRLHASAFNPRDSQNVPEEPVRGEGVLYLVDEALLPGALGYHARNTRETPFGFVFLADSDEWTVTLSHEALEMIVDPMVNVSVEGPNPRFPESNQVFHDYEVCDAVEQTSYKIDGIRVSNFITQQWFVEGDAPGTQNDFLGVGVESFGATEGSHLAFYDPKTETRDIFFGAAAPEIGTPMAARMDLYKYDRRRLGVEIEEELKKILRRCKSIRRRPFVMSPKAGWVTFTGSPGRSAGVAHGRRGSPRFPRRESSPGHGTDTAGRLGPSDGEDSAASPPTAPGCSSCATSRSWWRCCRRTGGTLRTFTVLRYRRLAF